MNTVHKVDVVIASSDRVGGPREAAALGDDVEAVDVAPDPKRRIIVLAPTKQVGQRHVDSLGIEPVAVVTPRSPHASRGITADEIVEAPGLSAEVAAGLMMDAAPALDTTGGA